MARRSRVLFLLATALIAAGLAFASLSAATIPPKYCGYITAKGKRYQVKAHIVGCSKAKPWMDRYLETGRKPPISGWSCRKFTGTLIRARCVKADRDFYAIKS